MSGQQQLLDHVEREEGGHPVVGKALPHLGEGQEQQPARVPEPSWRRQVLRPAHTRSAGLAFALIWRPSASLNTAKPRSPTTALATWISQKVVVGRVE